LRMTRSLDGASNVTSTSALQRRKAPFPMTIPLTFFDYISMCLSDHNY
jgi:hypothetical protein